MERVKNILQKLQELYYGKHQKSAIDIDLMLDYTRVMYADLLEWRTTFKEEPPTRELAEPHQPIVTAEESTAPAAQSEEAEVEQTVAAAPEPEQPEQNTSLPPDKTYQPVQHDEPSPRIAVEEATPAVVATEPEKEYIDTLQRDVSGISFEPPSAPEPRLEVKEELLIEEPAVQPVAEEKPAPPPVAIPLPDMAQMQGQRTAQPADLFSATKSKDIRGAIGINDKYLFLNELFNNHKTNYEETLDKLNHFSTAAQAEDWIRTKVAPVHKWDQEDATVTSFYSLVKRYFSER